jgi:hypothetical protein
MQPRPTAIAGLRRSPGARGLFGAADYFRATTYMMYGSDSSVAG